MGKAEEEEGEDQGEELASPVVCGDGLHSKTSSWVVDLEEGGSHG